MDIMDSADGVKPPKPYFMVREVAALFQVSTKTVVRWADDGKLTCMRTLGGHRRFPRDATTTLAADHGFRERMQADEVAAET